MLRNISIILFSWLCALCASGTDYTGTLTIGNAEDQVVKEGVVITINQNADGTYTALVRELSISYQDYVFDMGTVEFNNLEGAPDGDGYTSVSGTKEMHLSDISGIEELIPESLRPYMSGVLNKTFPIYFTARFNEKEITAHADYVIDISITIPFIGTVVPVVNLTMTADFYGTTPTAPAIKGDVDGNGVVDIDDLNILINIILGNDTADPYDGRALVNDDQAVDIDDVNLLINIMLS